MDTRARKTLEAARKASGQESDIGMSYHILNAAINTLLVMPELTESEIKRADIDRDLRFETRWERLEDRIDQTIHEREEGLSGWKNVLPGLELAKSLMEWVEEEIPVAATSTEDGTPLHRRYEDALKEIVAVVAGHPHISLGCQVAAIAKRGLGRA